MRNDLIQKYANDYARQFNAVAERHGFDLSMKVLIPLIELFAAALSAQGETAPKETAMSRVWCNQCRAVHAVGLHAGETAPAPVDEQLLSAVRHFRKTAGVHEGEHHYNKFTTCSRCEESYVRAEEQLDAAIATAAASPLPPGEGLEQIARETRIALNFRIVRGEATGIGDYWYLDDDAADAIILAALTRARAQGQ